MTLSRRTAVALALAGAWTVFTWVTFVRNFDPTDRTTGFVVVHMTLAAVNTALGVWLASVGVRGLRRDAQERRGQVEADRASAGIG